MNKNRFRIVFNAARGLRMVVSETARSAGSTSAAQGASPPAASLGRLSAVCGALCLAFAGPVAAQIIADPSAPGHQQATILVTPNGLPLVNITTPSAAGVSRNTYSQFDVGAGGAVLNNSRTNTQTQLGGWVQGNPWLAAGGARVILNEVNSANPSRLNGFVEVAGQRAEVVIANPAGISVNGGGFINASRATLTTGTALFNGGALEGYRVERGSIDIHGAGLHATQTDQTALLARAIQVNAGIWANDLKVVTGAADVSADLGQAQAHAPQAGGDAPAFALDVAALGGMYAGKITLVGTEAGVGVRNAGHLGATSGDLVLDTQGWLSNSGTVQAQRNVQITGQGNLENTGTVLAGAHATLHSAQDIRNSATGRVLAVGNQTLTAGAQLHNSGVLEAGQTLSASAHTVDNATSGEMAAGTTIVNAQESLTNRGLIDGVGTQINAGTVHNIDTGRIFGDHVSIAANTLINENDAVIAARERVDIGAQHITNREGALIFSAGDMAMGGTLDANRRATSHAQTLHNASATIESLGDMHLATAVLSNTNEHLAYVTLPDATTQVVDYVVNGSPIGADQVGWLTLKKKADGSPDYAAGVNREHLLPKDSLYSDPQFKNFYLTDAPYVPGHVNPYGNENSEWVPDKFNYDQHSPVWAAFYMAPPAWGNPGPKPGPTYTDDGQPLPPNPQQLAEWEAKAAPWLALNVKIAEFKATVNNTLVAFDIHRNYTQTTQKAVVTESKPGQILSGGHMRLDVGESGRNQDSHIVAGKTLEITGAAIENVATQVSAPTLNNGTLYNWGVIHHGCNALGECSDQYGWVSNAYQQTIARSVPLNIFKQEQNTAPNGTGTTVGGLVPLPIGGLFQPSPTNTNGYLLETDPRFADYRHWLGSDYLLAALGVDPSATHKRLGDGFYEQRLVREQIGTLTGHRFLSDHTSDEAQYQALMNAGATFAQAHELTPGVALTAAQVAALTSDIVWLETQTFTMPNGTKTQALVPRVYVVPRAGDLQPSGSLIAGQQVKMNLTGDFNNSGTVAGRQLVHINADNIHNQGGTLSGQTNVLQARTDINNVGGSIVAQDRLVASAGRDLNVKTTTAKGEGAAGVGRFSSESVDRVAGLYVTGNAGVLVASAGRDIELTAAILQSAGALQVDAGRDLKLGTVNTGERAEVVRDSKNFARLEQSAEVGSQISSAGATLLRAGRDIDARAASVQADGVLAAQAGRHVRITAGEESASAANAYRGKSSGMLSSSSKEVRSEHSRTDALASAFGGQQVVIEAGQDVAVQGSSVIGDQGITLMAGRDVSITAAQTRSASSHFEETRESGLMSAGMGVTVGSQQQSNAQNTTRTGAAGATVGAIEGDVTVIAARNYQQAGSDLFAPGGDVNVLAQDIRITEARTSEHTTTEQKFKQSGVTLSVSAPVVSALQGVASMGEAVGKSRDGRTQALGAAVGVLHGMQVYSDVKGMQSAMGKGASPTEAAGVSLSISIGASKSQSNSEFIHEGAQGSNLQAGGNVNLVASGAGKDSNILIQGSQVNAGDTVRLAADNEVNLLAARNTTTQSNSSKNSSGSIGFSVGAQTGYTVSASKGKGKGAGEDVVHSNTRIEAGKLVQIESGGDTTLQGAVVAANQVKADVGGNLLIESLQDTSTYSESSKQTGASVTFGPTPGASLSMSKTKINSDYASVNEQSGLRSGDGGFQVNVRGKTELVGAAITSSDQAAATDANRLITGTLVTRDLENTAHASAKSSGVGISSDMATQGKYGAAKALIGNSLNNADESGSSSGHTRAVVSSGSVTITDEAGQVALTGQGAAQTVASLNRDVATAHSSVQKLDAQAMKERVENERANRQAVAAEAFKFTDDAYRTMFVQKHPVYEVVKDEKGQTVMDSQTGKPQLRELEKGELPKPGPDGKVHIAANGIFNGADAAGNYANQHSTTEGPQYVIHFPEADSMGGELLVAGYQKFLENGYTGLSNSTTQMVDYMERYGQEGLHLDGHSRGSMTIGNAMEHLGSSGGGVPAPLSNTSINLFGPAYNAGETAGLLNGLSGGEQNSVGLQNHRADAIGRFLGGNPSTGGTIPEGSSQGREMVRAVTGQPITSHNCYGKSNDSECGEFWGSTNGIPQIAPTKKK